ncbi:TPA: hypothetical protein ACH3X1_001046 [Trebouxia sp. C0004]
MLPLVALAPYYLPLHDQQVISAVQQHHSASQPEALPQAQHPHYVEAVNDSNVDKYITASNADVPDAWHIQPVSHTDQQHEWSAVDQPWTDNLQSMPEEDFQHSLPLHGEEHGPHVWVGDLELVTPTAAFGLCTAVAALVGLVTFWKHRQAVRLLDQHVRSLRGKLTAALQHQAAAEGSLVSLKEQLAGMTEVHSQLEEAVKALQGKLELRDQELEVLNMELLAKDKVAALHQAIRDQMALQMPLPQEEEELSEPCGSEVGDMMTPPQPAPRSPPAQEGSEAEMSFRDLVDDSDEEEHEGKGRGKSAMHGQVLVDPEDLQNWAEMETEYRQVQEECQELRSLLEQRDDQLCTLNQNLLDLTVRMKGELGSKDDNVKDLRRWLDQAQGQLQNTQTALHEREADCKTLSLDLKTALADLQAFKDKVASSQGGTSPSKANTQQSIELAEMQQGLQKSNAALQDAQSQLYARQEHVQELTQRLEAAQAEVASLQAQLGAAEAREAALAREQELMQGALTGQVAGVMDMMRGIRVSLSARLNDSQAVCKALAQEVAAYKAKVAAYERGHVQGDKARLSLTGGPASSSASESFLAYTPTSTLAITASSLTPQSVTGSVAGPLALTPVRRMDLPHEGSAGMTPVGDQGFMDPCSPVAHTPEGSVNSGCTGPLALTPSPLPARLPSLERSVEPQQVRETKVEKGSYKLGASDPTTPNQAGEDGSEEERENIPPAGTPPSERKKVAVKRVRDAFSRHGQWHLVAFLKEVGCASPSHLEPVSQAQFDRVKDNGLRALHPANQQGKDDYHKTAAAEARKILQSCEFPGPKTGAKPVSPYWFARS